MKEFTREELKATARRDAGPVLIAYKGKVYDVSDSYHWRQRVHQVMHNAGEDLTQAMDFAPHGDDLLAKFPVVGKLKDKD